MKKQDPLITAKLFIFEEDTEQRVFMTGVVKGLMDLEEGREISLSEAKKLLGLK